MNVTSAVYAVLALAAPNALAQQPIPIRPLGAVVATATAPIPQLMDIRPLSDGRVLLNDIAHHRVLLLDSGLARTTVVLDSGTGRGRRYGREPGELIPYRGDTTLFVYPGDQPLIMISPAGALVREMPLSSGPDVRYLVPPMVAQAARPGVDALGRLVYQAAPPRPYVAPRAPGAPPNPPVLSPDTLPIVRGELATHRIDTVDHVAIGGGLALVHDTAPDGSSFGARAVSPVVLVDDWAVLSDGSIAIIRGADFHVDWINPDGSRTRSPPLPFDWQRLAPADKQRLIDSARAYRLTHLKPLPMGAGTWFDPIPDTAAVPGVRAPFLRRSAMADADGDVWIRMAPEPSDSVGPVYDVISRAHGLVDRVRIPSRFRLVGFGPGVAYLAETTGSETRLVRARIR